MKIIIQTIPHSNQRYDTVGDWLYEFDDGDPYGILQIRVSEFHSWQASALVAIHEMIEALTCRACGVDQKEVDEFDHNWKGGIHAEPGDDPLAPYHDCHMLASACEGMIAIFMGVNWKGYQEACRKLKWEPKPGVKPRFCAYCGHPRLFEPDDGSPFSEYNNHKIDCDRPKS